MASAIKDTRFKGKGIGTVHGQKIVGARLPLKIDAIVRSLPNRSDFIREAIYEKLEREGMLEGIEEDASRTSANR